MKRTPTQEWLLRKLEENQSLRQLAQTVGCDDCRAPAGQPCVNRYGEPLPMEHPRRIRRAERESTATCTYCLRLKLTPQQRDTEPWPEIAEVCEGHQRVIDEINEAREMGCDWP